MKSKWLLVVLSLFLVFIIAACNPGQQIDVDALIEEAQSQIDLPSETTSNLTLPSTITVSGQTVSISWSSGTPGAISNSGVVTRPNFDTGNASVVLTATFSLLGQSVTQNYTVIVVALEAVNFTVAFESNGGSTVSSVSVVSGQNLTAPTAPTRANFVFDGWYKEEALTNVWNFTTDTVTANITLFAKWTALPTYTVTFNPDNNSDSFTQSVIQGNLATIPTAPIKVGYEFVEWRKENDTPWIFTTTLVTENVILTAYYQPITYTITYNLPEGAEHIGTFGETFTILTQVNDLGSVTIANGNFDGWYDQPEGGNRVNFIPPGTIGNITLYARIDYFEVYTITFNDGFGTEISQDRFEGQYATEVTPNGQAGYLFEGWFLDLMDENPYHFETMVEEDFTLFAKWSLISYDITYMLDGGLATNPLTYTIETLTFELNDASKLGYNFLGWFTEEVSGLEVTEVVLGSTGHLTLYARYEPIVYTISYELNDGMATNPLTYTIETPTFTLSPATKADYEFIGWRTEGGDTFTEIALGSTGDLILYAHFVELIELVFYDNVDVQAFEIYSNNQYPNTMFVISAEGRLYSTGNNELGLLGIGGGTMDEDNWQEVKALNLHPDEAIINVYLHDFLAIIHTSHDRLIIWGLLGYDEDDQPIVETTPFDVTDLFTFSGDIENILHYGEFFVVHTTLDELYMFMSYTVTDVTPTLNPGESIQWANVFQYGDLEASGAFFTGERIFMIDIEQPNGFIDVTDELNLNVDAVILVVMYQDNTIHVITEDTYYFGGFGEFNEEDLYGFYAFPGFPLELNLLENEFILDVVSGSSLWTSESRLLTPVYIISDPDDEFPSLIKFVDITSTMALEEGEEIIAFYAPFIYHTSLGKLFALMIDTPFTDDPDAIPEVERFLLFDDNLDSMNKQFLGAVFVDYEPYYKTSSGLFKLNFGMDGLYLEPVVFGSLQEIHRELFRVDQLDALYKPIKEMMYQVFDQWFADETLSVAFDPMDAYDGMILYAGYVYTHYKITVFTHWDEDPIDPIWTEFGELPTKPEDPTREFYTFDGWYYFDEDFNAIDYDFDVPLDQNITLYPYWNSIEYQITLIFDLIDDVINQIGYANQNFNSIYINEPMGYEIIGLYYDEAFTLPVDSNDIILSDLTIYVQLQALMITTYYFDDAQEISFTKVFGTELYSFGLTADNKLYAWGFNNGGSLGIGFKDVYDFSTPFEWTYFTSLSSTEVIIDVYSLGTIHLMITSERMLLWGHMQDGQTVSLPTDVTSHFNFEVGEEISYFFGGYNHLVFITNFGQIIYYDTWYDTFDSYQTYLDLAEIMFVSYVNYNTNELFIVTLEGLYVLEFPYNDYSVNVTNLSSYLMLDEAIVFADVITYMVFENRLVTSMGRVLHFVEETKTIVELFAITLNIDEQIEYVFTLFGEVYVVTNERFLGVISGALIQFDQTEIGIDEMIVGHTYNMVLTNLGYVYVIDHDFETLNLVNRQYVPAIDEEILYYFQVNGALVGFTNEGRYLVGMGIEQEFAVMVGTDLQIVYLTYGEEYTMRTPNEKPGYMFDGWSTSYSSTWWFVTETNYDQALYAIYSPVE